MDNILRRLKEDAITSVRFEMSDMYGISRGRCIATKHFEHMAKNGLNFSLAIISLEPNGRCPKQTGVAEEIHYEDGLILPILDTFKIIPWLTKTARVFVEGVHHGEAVSGYPRVVARRQLERLKENGLSLWSAHEFEFLVRKKDTLEPVQGMTGVYAFLPMYEYQSFFQEVLVEMPKAGVDIENYQCEAGIGQLEITHRPEFGIKAADVGQTFKLGIKEIAMKHGLIASFMSKPYPDRSGSSAHYCHSLWDVEGKVPKLYDKRSPTGLTELGEHWVAGLLHHARGIAVLMAPTVNCLKRYKRYSFAPWNATWGPDNRTCAIRVKINGERGTYIENRMGASGCSPYISMAATIAAGLDGIINKLPLPKGVDGAGSAYDDEYMPPDTLLLPDNMEEAVQALLDDQVITQALGEQFIKCFVAIKRDEIRQEQEAVSKGNVEEWERDFLYSLI